MFERYALFEIENLTDRFSLQEGVPKGVKKRYNISPTQTAPVIRSVDTHPILEHMKWGLTPKDSKNMNSVFRYKTFSTQSEKAFSKPAWDDGVRNRRCIVPANGFYQWRKKPTGKEPYFISHPTQSLLGLAGIYSEWTDPEGVNWNTYSILTIDEDSASVYGRLPVILHKDDEATWLNADTTDTSSLILLMRPYDGEPLVAHRVPDTVFSTKIDNPTLITSA